jgi:hypothetical protein
MSVQTSYSEFPLTARKGQLYDNGQAQAHDVESARATAAAVPGSLVLLAGPTAGELEAADATPLAALTVDVDAIAETVASAGTAQELTDVELDGVVGPDLMNPARQITFIPNGHADWDPSTVIIRGIDAMGNKIMDTALIATSTTGTTSLFFARVDSVYIPAQTGAGGAATIGVAANTGVYNPDTVGILIRDSSREPLSTSDAVAADDRVDVLKSGKIFVEVEDTVPSKGAPAFLRVLESGSDLRGQWSGVGGAGFTEQPWACFETVDDGATVKIAVLKKRF